MINNIKKPELINDNFNNKCFKCNGSGLMKMEPIICQKCKGQFHPFCIYCENRSGFEIQPYETCDQCLGNGFF